MEIQKGLDDVKRGRLVSPKSPVKADLEVRVCASP
jgi:hypothetical protein